MEFPFGEESIPKATSDEGLEVIEVKDATISRYSIAKDRPRRLIKPL